ncbi:MAG: class I lanthipeptide [Bacteroidetes bacterium]|nr:class I lanthipeptide [Bacteroidota bacterium]
MKKSINKLSLNKSTISNLSKSELSNINGGAQTSKCNPRTYACFTRLTCPPPTIIK